MKPITIDHNWRDFNQLDGKDLVEDEVLKIQWPDGDTTISKIKIEKGAYQVQDHGNPWTIHSSRAYLDVLYRGVKTRIYLDSDKRILCERVKKSSQ